MQALLVITVCFTWLFFFLIMHKLLLSVFIHVSCFIYIYFSYSHFDVPVLLSLKGGRHN